MSSPRARHALVITALLVASLAVFPAASAASPPEAPLEDGNLYWQGSTIVATDYAPDANQASLYTEAGEHVRNISLQAGDLTITTNDLSGEYYVTAPGAPRTTFEVIKERIDVDVTQYRIHGNSQRTTVHVEVSSNRQGTNIQIDASGISDLAARASGDITRVTAGTVAGDRETEFTVDLTGLEPGEYLLEVSDTELDVTEFATIKLNKSLLPPTSGTHVGVERGGAYWRPTTLAVDGVDANTIYKVEALDGSPVRHQQSSTQGTLYVDTQGFDGGIYRVLTSNGTEVTRFQVNVQTLSASVADGSLQLESNRANYSAYVTVSNSSTTVTKQALPDRPIENGTARLEGLSSATAIGLNTSALAAGDYSVFVRVPVGNVSAGTSFSVASTSSSADIEFTTVSPTTTQSTAGPSTPAPSNTTTPSTTDSLDQQAGTSTTGESGAPSPGFGVVVALLAGVLASLLALQRRGA